MIPNFTLNRFLIFFLFFFHVVVFAATKTYTGANNGNWSTASNWSPSGVPNGTDDVIIPSGKIVVLDVLSVAANSITVSGVIEIPADSNISINSLLIVVSSPSGSIFFNKKSIITLPQNVALYLQNGSKSLDTSDNGVCSNNTEIHVGTTNYAVCTGGGALYSFDQVESAGGINVVTAGVIGVAQNICGGTAPNTLTSATAATGSGTITYQWQATDSTGSYVTITSAISENYLPPVLNATTSYRRRTVSVINGQTFYSQYTSSVTITITSTTAAPTGTASQSFCASNNPTVANLTATGTGIKWYAASSGGAALATNTVLTNGTHYYASQTLNGCESATRFEVTATVNNVPTIETITAPSALCSGGSLGLSAPTVTTNGSTIISQGWQISTTSGGSSYTALSVPYTVAFTDNGKNIRYTATNGCGTTTSNVAVLTVNNVPTIAAITVPSALCSGGSLNPSVPSVTVNGSTVTSSGWQLETAVGSGTFANQAMAYTVTFADNGKKIRYYATNGCGTTISNEVTITVNDIPTIATISTPAALCSGSSLNLTNPTVTTNGSVVSASGWQLETTVGGGAYSNLTVPYTVAFVDDGKRIRYYATNACSTVYSNEVIITVNDVPTAPVVGAITQPNCTLDTGSVELSGLPSGSWTLTRSGTSSATITGTGSSTTVSGLVDGGNYTFTVSNGSCTSGSSDEVDIDDISTMTSTWNGSGWVNGDPNNSKRIVFSGDFSSTGDIVGCSCKVTSGANVVIKDGHTLKITNGVQVINSVEVVNGVQVITGGTLTFENKASLVQINENPEINSGNIIYKRTTPALNRYDFVYWSSPVGGQTLKALSPNTLGDKYYSFNNGWKIEYNGAATMAKGKGYIVRAPQSYFISGNPQPFNASFIGIPHNGLVSFSIAADQTHLLGNPYPSALDADEFLNVNSDLSVPEESRVLEGTLYFWTHNSAPSDAVAGDATYNYTASDYATYNRIGGVKTALTGSQPTGKIAAGQGFFAPAKAGGIVVFNNTMRVSGGVSGENNSQFFKSSNTSKTTTVAAATEKSRIWLNLTNKQGAFKQTLVGYITGATNGYDAGYDGMSYDGNQFVDFYSVNNAVNLSIQGRALPFVKQDSVVLGYKSTIKGEFKVSIDRTDGALATQNIFLEDKDLKVLHDLKQGAYTFNTEKGVFNNRFVLRYVDKNAVEPVVETPVVETPVIDSSVTVSVKQDQITVSSSEDLISKIIIYDIAGKIIYQKEDVSANDFMIQNLLSSKQVLLVTLVLENGKTTSTKIVY